MKLLSYTICTLAFIVAAVFLCRDNHWVIGILSLLCAATCRAKTEDLP